MKQIIRWLANFLNEPIEQSGICKSYTNVFIEKIICVFFALDELVLAWILCHDHPYGAKILRESLNVLPLETVKASWWVAVCVSGRFPTSPAIETTSIWGESDHWNDVHHELERVRHIAALLSMMLRWWWVHVHNISPPVSCSLVSCISGLLYLFCCISFDVDVAFDPSVLGGSILVPWKRMTANFNPFSEALYHVTDRWNVFTWCSGCIGRFGQWAHKSGILSVWLGQWLLSPRRQVSGWSQGHLLCRNWSENDGPWFDGTNGTVLVLCKLGITYDMNYHQCVLLSFFVYLLALCIPVVASLLMLMLRLTQLFCSYIHANQLPLPSGFSGSQGSTSTFGRVVGKGQEGEPLTTQRCILVKMTRWWFQICF